MNQEHSKIKLTLLKYKEVHSPYFSVLKEWLVPLAEPRIVDALIQVSYLVSLDNDFRRYEVVLAGTVMAGNQQNTETFR